MSSDGGEPESKRTREACLNCRRKKTRCPGERPSCGFCVRLGQACLYASATTATSTIDPAPQLPAAGSSSTAVTLPLSPPVSTTAIQRVGKPPSLPAGCDGDLANRVAQLEAQLRAQLGNGASSGLMFLQTPLHRADGIDLSTSPLKRKLSAMSTAQDLECKQPDPSTGSVDDMSHRFSTLPPGPVMKHLVEVYFLNCQNQPYCFFHESHMRRCLLADEVPRYLLLAMAASAVRYSMHDYYKDNQMLAVEQYARASWSILLERFFANDQCPDVAMAQATALLAVTDFTAGHHRLGWVKVGLAIRLVQDLRLNAEPENTLPAWQKEEIRRVFWSLYLLDKFFACSRSRPVSILDKDCTVALPCDEQAFREESDFASMPTLAVLRDPFDFISRARLDGFATVTLMCSLLNRSVRNVIQDGKITSPCWDCRSDFAQTSSILMSFESVHSTGDLDLKAHIVDRFGTYEGFDRQRAGHFVWARGIYHLCGSMLYHPLALYRQRQACGETFPATFAREVLSRCQHHLTQLDVLLRTVQETGCCARGSFLGYLAACAASLHKIFLHSTDQHIAAQAQASLDSSVRFLRQTPVCWQNHLTMAAAVTNYDLDPDVARCLIDLSFPATLDIEPLQMDHIRRTIDYAWLSDASQTKPAGELSDFFTFDSGVEGWTPFQDLYEIAPAYTFQQGEIGFGSPYAFNNEPSLGAYPGT